MTQLFIALLIGLAAGFAIGFFYSRSKMKPSGLSREEIETQYVAKVLFEQLQKDLSSLKSDLKEKEEKVVGLASEGSAGRKEVENLKGLLEKERVEIEKVQGRLKVEFENLANKIAKENSAEFAKASKENLGNILNPLKEDIKNFKDRVDTVYNEENKDRASLKTEIKQLLELNRQVSEDATNLALALKGDSKKQGDWGEFQLEMLLEKAGLVKDVHFKLQYTEDRSRPDCIIILPDGKNLVIDSKVSLTAYERFSSAKTDEEQKNAMSEHLASINSHIKSLSGKNYQNLYSINAPDFVLMFIPIESALAIAAKEQGQLFEEAMKKNVVIVTGSILLATLRTISYIWKQEVQKKNVLEIAKQGGALYDKFVGFLEDLKDIKVALENATKSYNLAMNKLSESDKKGDTILGRAEKLKNLGARATKQISRELLGSSEEEEEEPVTE